jgi:hypothetical protein
MIYGKDWYWPDLAAIIVLALGFWRGRKHGMSTVLLPMIKMMVIVVGGAIVYKPAGDWLRDMTDGYIQRWVCYFLVYLFFAFVVHLIFNAIKRAVGEKLVGSDLFGSMEYYFGMLAGIIKYAFIFLFFLALLRVRAIDYEGEKAYRKLEKDNIGNISFPTITSIQIDTFDVSLVGRFTGTELGRVLMQPTPSENLEPHETIGSKRARDIDDASQIKTKK